MLVVLPVRPERRLPLDSWLPGQSLSQLEVCRWPRNRFISTPSPAIITCAVRTPTPGNRVQALNLLDERNQTLFDLSGQRRDLLLEEVQVYKDVAKHCRVMG
jgi:hypothetical protein